VTPPERRGEMELPPDMQLVMPLVIAPDVVLDLVLGRGGGAREAEALFEAIAADVEDAIELRPAWMAPTTPSLVHHVCSGSRDRAHAAREVVTDLMRLVRVAPLGNADYAEAATLGLDLDSALQFVTCRRVDAKYLVTREDFGMKRAPVARRTPAEVLPLFRR
jgi:hypothetical protein